MLKRGSTNVPVYSNLTDRATIIILIPTYRSHVFFASFVCLGAADCIVYKQLQHPLSV